MLVGYATTPMHYALIDWDANGLPRQVDIPYGGLPYCWSSSQLAAGQTIYLTSANVFFGYLVIERSPAGTVKTGHIAESQFFGTQPHQHMPVGSLSISPDLEEASWANDSTIYVEPIAYTPGTPDSLHLDLTNPGKRHLAINTGLSFCQAPRFIDDALTKRKGVVFSSGLSGSQLHCIRDLASPVVTNIPVPASLPIRDPSSPSARLR